MKHKIAEFIKSKGITPYRFWKETGLSRPTAYRLCGDATYLPSGEVLEKICDAYKIQPGEILEWVEAETQDEIPAN